MSPINIISSRVMSVMDSVSKHINRCVLVAQAVAAFVIGYVFGWEVLGIAMLVQINVLLLSAERHRDLNGQIAAHAMARDMAQRMVRGEV